MKKVLNKNSLQMSAEEFRFAGYGLVDRIAEFLEALPEKRVTTGESPKAIRALLHDRSLPLDGQPTQDILAEAADLLFDHSLFNGHPRFWGYITSSAAPIGALADLLAASVNANVGAFALSPMATEIERQSVQWLAELIGYDPLCGGLFVSGGNMANFLGFLAARKNKIRADIRQAGLPKLGPRTEVPPWGLYAVKPMVTGTRRKFTVYCAKGTHTWIEKAVELFGHGTEAIRWIDTTASQQLDVAHLQTQIDADIRQGHIPFLVIGNAGSVSTGVVDPLAEIAAVCRTRKLWFHVDGAYGAPAAMLAETADLFSGLTQADSIALDPHKWLYSPLEAGCILVRNPRHLHDAFSFHPDYYNFEGDGEERPVNFHEYGMQNSRGFRALKVWLSIKQAGKNGLSSMIRKDIQMAEALFQLVDETPHLQPITQHLSVTTFRYTPLLPPGLETEAYLNQLNERLLNRLQSGGEVFLSNAVIDGRYCLRVCVVNFRTTYADLEALVDIVTREGRRLHETMLTEINRGN